MKILLVYPPITKFERYSSYIGSSGGNQVPLGIFYLAAFIREQGYSVDVIDAEANNLEATDIVDRIAKEHYEIIGISTTTVAFHRSLELAESIKRAFPGITIIVGGPHVSSQPTHPLQFSAFDFAIRNEGEESMAEFIRAFVQHNQLSDWEDADKINGLIYRKGGEIISNKERPYVEKIDSIPFPAYDLIDDLSIYTPPPSNYLKSPVINIITSRGCPNQCTFCDNNTFGRNVRFRSAENVVDEVEFLVKKYGVKEIAFVDDTFTLIPDRIYEIFTLTKSRGLAFPWTCMARINTVDKELLRFMRDNGCWHISFGIESASSEILKMIKKNIVLDQVENVINTCRDLGILTKGFFIIGHPNETIETINETIKFATRIKFDDIVVTINTPMPGSDQFEHISEYGEIDTSNWSKYNYWNPVFVPFGLTRDIINKKHKEFYRRFYLRPRVLWRYFKSFFAKTGLTRLKSILLASRYLIFRGSPSK